DSRLAPDSARQRIARQYFGLDSTLSGDCKSLSVSHLMPPTTNPNLNSVPSLQRIDFFHFQRLLAGDLRDMRDRSAALRILHNRTFHGWGIGVGLSVTGKRGDRSVTVSPGYAVDANGFDVLLDQPINQIVPQTKLEKTYVLTVRYAPDG